MVVHISVSCMRLLEKFSREKLVRFLERMKVYNAEKEIKSSGFHGLSKILPICVQRLRTARAEAAQGPDERRSSGSPRLSYITCTCA